MQTPQPLPSVQDLGQAIATTNDWRAIVIVMAFVIISLMGFVFWREWQLVRLTRAIDKMAAAMWAWRLALAEERAEKRAHLETEELAQLAREHGLETKRSR